MAQEARPGIGPIVDCNVHLWDQRDNPVFWLSDRTVVRDMLCDCNVATRIDAIGTIFGDWTLSQIRPWLLEVAGIFGPPRCMLGSDLPIENLRSGFGPLYAAYDAIFSAFSDDERAWLFHRTAERWYASAPAADA